MRIARFAVVLLIATLLSGCSGDSLPLSTALTPDGASNDAAGNSADPYATTTNSSKPASAGLDSLDFPLEPAGGGREVISNPTMADVLTTGTLPEMSWGRADAPVTMVMYASLTCPHCRQFHTQTFKDLKRTYIDTGKVRFIMREFPIGKTSGMATIALRCAKPDKYLDLYGKFMIQQASWVSQEVRLDAIFAVAAQVGMTRAQFDACRQNQGMIEGLKWIKDRGRTLGIIGTPNFFIQNKLIKSTLTMSDIRAAVEPLLGGHTASATTVTPR